MRRIPSREILWGSFHISEDEREVKEYLQNCLESILAFVNPEAFKKYKERVNGQKDMVNDQFAEELKNATGMSVGEYKKLIENGQDEGIEFPDDPFVI